MHNWKNFGRKLLFPPVWLLILLTICSTAGLLVIFAKGMDQTIAAYVVYALSFYTLTIDCIFFVCAFPDYYKNMKEKLYSHPYGNKYMTDIGYRVRVSLYISLAINLLYSAFKLVSGVVYASFWWGAVAVYYIVLSLIRFLLLRYMRSGSQHIRSDWQRYRLTGILLVLLHLSLTGIVIQMVRQNRAVVYPEVIIIASAVYTFYSVTVSVIDIVKYRKYQSPVMSASKAIRFASALVSLLTLETAMLARYGEEEAFRQIMTACTGTGVCLITLGMSAYMIVRSTKQLQKLKSDPI